MRTSTCRRSPTAIVTASFDGFSLPLGKYSIDALKRAQGYRRRLAAGIVLVERR